jgi:hypothetical protein
VIVRISGEGQFRIPDDQADRLNELDNRAVEVAAGKDEAQFQEVWNQILTLVESGDAVPDDELVESDVILPPRDISFEEACAEFTGEGLIPD